MAKAFADANKTAFDKLAAEYDSRPWLKEGIANVKAGIRSNLDFIGANWVNEKDSQNANKQCRLLDYACGPGTVSLALMDYVTEMRGMDISPNMVARYNNDLKIAGCSHERANATEGDLLEEEGPPEQFSRPDLFNFDIAAVGLGFHHFHDPALAVKRLAERLNPGGVVLIIDAVAKEAGNGLYEQMGRELNMNHTINKHGFSAEDMKVIFEAEGLENVGYHVLDKPIKLGPDADHLREIKVFLGRAQKKRT